MITLNSNWAIIHVFLRYSNRSVILSCCTLKTISFAVIDIPRDSSLPLWHLSFLMTSLVETFKQWVKILECFHCLSYLFPVINQNLFYEASKWPRKLHQFILRFLDTYSHRLHCPMILDSLNTTSQRSERNSSTKT